jgi:ABC-type antimicrobial peptide transport system permease subunit
MLLSSNPSILKEYIDWVYLTKVVQAKRRLTSISFMTHEGLTQDYKMNILLKGKKNLSIDRSTPLPDKYVQVFQEIGVAMQNYGDLAFLFQMEQPPEMQEAFAQITDLGFDSEIIKRIV